MSDDAEQFYSEWTAIFGGTPQKLLCTWHVDRAWRKSLSKVTDKQSQISVYHKLRVLLEETDVERFDLLLQNTVLQWSEDPSTVEFYKYFPAHYSQHFKQWAMCYRKRACINTNMFVEAFHRVLKYVYLKGTVNNRIDACISMLLRFARDKLFDRLQKIERGENTSRLQLIANRHKSSLNMSTDLVSIKMFSTESLKWEVKSTTSSDTYYVTQENKNCPYTCLLKCRVCSVCVHQFSCTCLDSLTQGTICKHVHLVMRFNNTVNKKPEHLRMTDSQRIQTQSELLTHITTRPTIEGHTQLRNRLLTKLSNLKNHVTETNDKESLIALNRKLDVCLALFGPTNNSKNTNEPSNKLIKVQRSFYSTKRKRQTTNIRIAKPSREEKNEISYISFDERST